MNAEHPIHILIAEDEPLILNNIAKKAALAGDWAHICGKAESGREALAILEEQPVDILITDIEMPGMSGLDLTRIVRERFPSVRIIILSGYSNFEYARTAVHYGVHEYLLKPVAQEAFTELLCRLRDEITAEHSNRKREVLTMALSGSPIENTVPSAFADEDFFLLYLILGNYDPAHLPQEISPEYRNLWQKLSLDSALYQIPGLKHTWLIDEAYGLSKFVILHAEKNRLSAGYLRLALNHYLSETYPGIPYLMILYPETISYREIWSSAKELRRWAAQCARPFAQDAVLCEATEETAPLLSQRTQISDMLRSLTGGPAFLSYARRTLEDYIKHQYPSRRLLALTDEIFASACTNFMSDASQYQEACNSVYSAFYCCAAPDTFVEMVMNQLRILSGTSENTSSGEQLCEKITLYIQHHYCSRLSLNDLSTHFGYTPSYINRVFKKKLGLSPVQYITNMKMEKAKELLCSGSAMDIQDIAAAVGYEDARYFSRVFKNETGMTPTAWGSQNR